MIKTNLILVLTSILLSAASSAWADTFRCPNGDLVATGDVMGEVAVKCDKPTLVSKREEPGETVKGKVLYNTIEEWTYNNGPKDFIYTLVFKNGVLAEIRSGGYGN